MLETMLRTATLLALALFAGSAAGYLDQSATGLNGVLVMLIAAGFLLALLAPRWTAASILALALGVLVVNAAAPAAPDIDMPTFDRALLSALVAAIPAALGGLIGAGIAYFVAPAPRRAGTSRRASRYTATAHRAPLSQAARIDPRMRRL